MTHSARSAAAEAGDHPVVEKGARLGYAANGVLHLVLGWLALQLALGSSSGDADQSGALAQLGSTAIGSVLLWLIVVGFVLLALWQLSEVAVRDSAGDRVKAGAKAVVYAVLAVTAFRSVQGSGSGSSGDEQTTSLTATLMEQPFGRVLVGLVGLGIIAVGVYHVVKGWKKKFLEDLQRHPGTWGERAGRAGYVAKGIALAVVGGLFGWAAVTHDPEEAQGLDGALQTILEAPFGQVLLVLVALGLAAYGVYSFFRARYGKV
ncbi:DUF1206 domain-containing protein [Actinotalea sp. BY-33]|uniref:DUF1206 domain-containing protein n=1 Tax=Actinotalea soli TaxID=2819234 RepID=A0A939LR90_9CELL|nr:DUF1206 domain-containing protein [Actinotalea soli]MBO1751580.1 DUF1206 domain-containing protein [Actinotalea soli]